MNKPQNCFSRIARHFEKEEAGVGLWEEVVRGVVLVQDLKDKVSTPEVCDGSRKSCPAPHKPEEQAVGRIVTNGAIMIVIMRSPSFCGRELLHDGPEPGDKGGS